MSMHPVERLHQLPIEHRLAARRVLPIPHHGEPPTRQDPCLSPDGSPRRCLAR